MKFGVIVFPGSNCDHDAYHVVSKHIGQPVDFVWHKDTDLSGYDAILIPGGFSYGDYLRAGALASFSIVLVGMTPFITASVITQLLTKAIPRLEELHNLARNRGRQ